MNITEKNRSLDLNPLKSDPENLEIRIRSSIFIITGVCAGLPALVWSVRDIIHHRKNGLRISIFIILLLFTDFLELLFSPYILKKIIVNEIPCSGLDWTCRVFKGLWWAMKDSGFLLNQLVALEGILSVKYPRFTAYFFSSLSFKIVHIFVFIYIIICQFYWNRAYFWLVLFMFIVSVIPWIISCGALGSADHQSHTSKKSDHHILVIFIFTLLVFYLQYIFIIFRLDDWGFSWSIFFNIPVYLMSLRLISDPLLCVLVCRQMRSFQTSQNHEGRV